MLLEFGFEGASPLARLGLLYPGVPLASAPPWLLASMGVLALGAKGMFSGMGATKAQDTY